jgi:hypothetical protein
LFPASSVTNPNKSGFTPVVNVGAVPAGHLVFVNQEFVTTPPLIYSIINDCARAVAGGFVIAHVTVPVPDADTAKKLLLFKFNVTVVPPTALIVPDTAILISKILKSDPDPIDAVNMVPTGTVNATLDVGAQLLVPKNPTEPATELV